MMNVHNRLVVFLLTCLILPTGCGPTGESPPPGNKPAPPAKTTDGDTPQAKTQQNFDAFFKTIQQRKQAFAGTTISAGDFQTKSVEVLADPRDPSLWVAQVELSSPQGPGGIVVLYELIDGRWKFHFDRSFLDIGEGPEPLPRSLAPDEPPALGDVIEVAFHE
jgi:hypothetical protein